MPVLELAAGNEHKGVLCIRQLIGALEAGRDKLASSVRRWEVVNKDHPLTRIMVPIARVGDAVLCIKPFPGHTGDAGHRAAHLLEDIFRLRIVPIQAEAPRQLLNDPKVLPRLTGAIQRLSTHLHTSVCVRKRTGFFRESRCRQQDICEGCCFRQENILQHHMVERRKARARVIEIGVRHSRVLTHDVHATDLTLVGFIHDLDDRQTRIWIEFRMPVLGEKF